MKIIKVIGCGQCPYYSSGDSEYPDFCKEEGMEFEEPWVSGYPDWCPLEYAITDATMLTCPECGGKLSFGLSNDKWVCIECGLLSRDYYEENKDDRA